MPNPFVKGWKYLMAAFGAKIDERADPQIQIQQAIQDAQRQHQSLTQQAASVIGNQRQLEMKLARQVEDVEKLKASARQALVLADRARSQGDTAKATEYEQTAQSFATQLVSGEKNVEDLKALHGQAAGASAQAKEAVEQSAKRLQGQLAERSTLLTQLQSAKMQEQVSRSLQQISDMSAPSNTPTLGEVRDKIEQRYATALGQAELAGQSTAGRMLEVEKSTMDMAGAARLDEIRASLGGDSSAGSLTSGSTAALEAGSAPAPAGEQVTSEADRASGPA